MSCLLPHFELFEPLDGARAWTARFDSYDQRLDTAYYRITLHDHEEPGSTLMAAVSIVGDDWTTPAFAEDLRSQLASIAATGVTNTPYTG